MQDHLDKCADPNECPLLFDHLNQGRQILTYAELNGEDNQLAHCLLQKKVGPECLVGLCME